MPQDWLHDFSSFTLVHSVTVLVLAAAMATSCWLGRRCGCGSPREVRFRHAWGWFGLALAAFSITWYLLPSEFDITMSLPLHLCDLGVLVAALAMLTRCRLARTLLYFWGIGLSTQAFITPTLGHGPASVRFWLFWIDHTMIVGSAVYDLIVGGYRPRARDFAAAALTTLAYGLLMFALDAHYKFNYGFVGPTQGDATTVVSSLGPWPWRVGVIAAIVLAEFLLLWVVWPLTARLFGPRGSDAPRPAST